MDKKKILIIDDEKDFCALAKINFEKTGHFDVSFACSGDDGIQLAKKWKPHLIVLDLIMPGIKGFEVSENLEKDEDTAAIPVIILTAILDEKTLDGETMLKTAKLYKRTFLRKPVSFEELLEKVEDVLNSGGFK